MQKREFINRIRSLYNIDGHLLGELSSREQLAFLRDPVTYFLQSDETQSDAIMREIENRQASAISDPATASVSPATVRASVGAFESKGDGMRAPATARAPRANKLKPKVEGQREMLLPIPGGKPGISPASPLNAGEREEREDVSFRRSR